MGLVWDMIKKDLVGWFVGSFENKPIGLILNDEGDAPIFEYQGRRVVAYPHPFPINGSWEITDGEKCWIMWHTEFQLECRPVNKAANAELLKGMVAFQSYIIPYD